MGGDGATLTVPLLLFLILLVTVAIILLLYATTIAESVRRRWQARHRTRRR